MITASKLIPLALLALIARVAPAYAQASPTSAQPVGCQGGTGSMISSVGSTAVLVCSASTYARGYWRISNGNAAGGATLYCTDDGTTPSSSHWGIVVYPQGFTSSGGEQNVSPAAISCVAASTTPIAAYAVQSGVP